MSAIYTIYRNIVTFRVKIKEANTPLEDEEAEARLKAWKMQHSV